MVDLHIHHASCGTVAGFMHYTNPMTNCTKEFHERILELMAMEDKTKRWERKMESKKQQQQQQRLPQSSSSTDQWWTITTEQAQELAVHYVQYIEPVTAVTPGKVLASRLLHNRTVYTLHWRTLDTRREFVCYIYSPFNAFPHLFKLKSIK